MKSRSALPVDTILPEILDSLKRTANLVIEAPPGAGKTTRVPPALLHTVSGEVVVLDFGLVRDVLQADGLAEKTDVPTGPGAWIVCSAIYCFARRQPQIEPRRS